MALYTWNSRQGTIDRLVASTGLEVVGTVLLPGIWLENTLNSFWKRYIFLLHIEEENTVLKNKISLLEEELVNKKEAVEQNKRLHALLKLDSPNYKKIFAEVIAIRFGPLAIADTLLINKGSDSFVRMYAPVLVSTGLVGRVVRISANNAVVLPITAPDSKLSVVTRTSRVSGIIVGRGGDSEMQMLYVPRSIHVEAGEEIITSGVDGIFPKGIPVGVITSVEEEDLFHIIRVKPFINIRSLEEIVVLEMPENGLGLLGNMKGML